MDFASAFEEDQPLERGAKLAPNPTTKCFQQLGELPTVSRKEGESDVSYNRRLSVANALVGHAERVETGRVRTPRPGKEPKPLALREDGKVDLTIKKKDLNEQAKKYLKAKGWKFIRTDYWDAMAGVQRDFLTIFDYIAWDVERGKTIGVQITSRSAMSARRNKINLSGKMDFLRPCHWEALILGFDKVATGRYRVKEEWI